jgi:hypothetical protein
MPRGELLDRLVKACSGEYAVQGRRANKLQCSNGVDDFSEMDFAVEDADLAPYAAHADALLDAFHLPERLAQMGAEGQKACLENFTWDNTVKRIVDGIDNCDTAPAGGGLRN